MFKVSNLDFFLLFLVLTLDMKLGQETKWNKITLNKMAETS